MESKGPRVFLTGPLFLTQTTTQWSVISRFWSMEIISGDSGNDEPVDSMEMFDFSYGKTVGFNAGFGMSSSLQAVELLGRPLPEVLFHCCPARQRGAYARPSIHIISCLWCGPSRKTREVWLDIQTLPKMVHSHCYGWKIHYEWLEVCT